MKILVLAAGYGTRLYPLVTDTPKPLLKVSGKPLIDYILDHVQELPGLNEVLVVTNNKFYLDFQAWAKGKREQGFPVKVSVINDGTMTPEDRLGSVGDIHFALEKHPFQDDLLVVGGDNLFDFNLAEYLDFARKNSPAVSIGVYDIGDISKANKFGVVNLAGDGKVDLFEEKPPQPKSSLIAMCFYHFPRESLGLIGKYMSKSGKADNAGHYIQWLVKENAVYGFKFRGRWYDIGSIEAYQEAQKAFSKEK
ncbi:MAG: nucleotidyltransferase family protein [Candidatus Omnitrophota bacterium]|nr:nucleotidyltransferase family protein [Candidatus Omnitrophota bacterium]MDZ4241289.1 nucleotidyltransferase family protein [Candidatus Omnitrophota bacterium]